MAFKNNRAALRPRSSFQQIGGTSILFRHPFLAFQISDAVPIDEVDVSRALRLNDTFFRAKPTVKGAVQEMLVDGSVVTITNRIGAGQMSLQVLETTGFVGDGDFIAALHLIKATGDDVGGTLTVIRHINGRTRIRVYYGVSVEDMDDEVIAGNAIVPHSVTLLYSGWVDMMGSSALNTRAVWAVGNRYGLRGEYKPYAIHSAETGDSGSPYSETAVGGASWNGDTMPGDDNNIDPAATGLPGGAVTDIPGTDSGALEDFTDDGRYPDPVSGSPGGGTP